MSPRQLTCRCPSKCVIKKIKFPNRYNRIVAVEKVGCEKVFYPPPISSVYGTPIKVSFGRIRGVTPPEICDCPEIPCISTKEKWKKRLILLAKTLIVLEIIRESTELGIWSDAEKTAELSYAYMEWAKDFFPTKNKIQRTAEEIYDMRRIKYNMAMVWNSFTTWLVQLAQSLPDVAKEMGSSFIPDGQKCEKNKQ